MLKVVLSDLFDNLEPDTLIITAAAIYKSETVLNKTFAVSIRSELGDVEPVGYFDFELIKALQSSVKEQARAHVAKRVYQELRGDPLPLLQGLEIRFSSFTYSHWVTLNDQT